MKFFERLSIKNKLITIILSICVTVTILGFVLTTVDAIRTFRTEMIEKLSFGAAIASDFLVSDLAFNDNIQVGKTLQRLKVFDDVRFACVYSAENNNVILARFGTPDSSHVIPSTKPGFEIHNNMLHLTHKISFEDKIYGTLYIQAATTALQTKINDYIITNIIMLALLISVASFAALWLQSLISAPLLKLARTADNITRHHNYNLRSDYESDDEIGLLSASFNRMLEQIEREHKKLHESEHKFRSYIESAPNGIFVADEKGNYVDVNSTAAEITGYAQSELIGMNLGQITIEEDRQRAIEEFQTLATRGKLTTELGFYQKDGTRRYWTVNAVKLSDSRFLGFAIDITDRKLAEEELLMKDYAVDSSINAIGITDLQGKMIYVNQAAIKLWGYDNAEEILGRSLPEFWHGEGINETMDALQKRGFHFGEDTAKGKNGNIFPVQFSASIVKDHQGEPKYIFGSFLDISAQKKSQEAVRESMLRYHSLFENLPVSVWDEDFSEVKSFLEGIPELTEQNTEPYLIAHPEIVQSCVERVKITDINQATLKLHKAKSKEELFAGLEKTFTADSLATFRLELIAIIQGKTSMQAEGTVKTLDGHERFVNINWSVAPGFEKSLKRVLVTLEDITERKRAEEAHRFSEERLEIIFNSVHHLIALSQYEGRNKFRVVAVNPAMTNHTGFEQEAILGKLVEDILPPKAAQKRIAKLQEAVDLKKSITYEGEEVVPAGKFTIETTVTPIFDNQGNCTHVVGVNHDITERKKAELELQASEARFRTLAECSAVGIFFDDAEGNATYVNDSCAKIVGLPYDEILGTNWTKVIHPDDLERVVRKWNEAVENETIFHEEYRWVHADGKIVHSIGLVAPVRDAQGKLIHFVGTLIDISERKKAEDQLRESEERYRRIIEDQTEFIVRWLPGGDRTFVNEAYCRYYGITPEQALNTSFLSPIPDEERERMLTRLAQLTPENPVSSDEHRVMLPNGKVGWNRWTDRAFFNEKGGVIEYQSVGRDITARKNLEEARRESEQRLAIIFNSVQNWIILSRVEGVKKFRVVAINPAMTKYSGLSQEQVLGKTFDQFLPPDVADERIGKLQKAIDAKSSIIFEREVSVPGGTFIIETTLTPIFDDAGKCRYVLGVNYDITERKKIEEELRQHRENLESLVQKRTAELQAAQHELIRKERLAVLGQLTATVSHELRNPLGTIRTSIYSVDKKIGGQIPATNRALDRIKRNIIRCDNIIGSLLDFTRVHKVELQSIDFDKWLTGTIAEYDFPPEYEFRKKLNAKGTVELDIESFRRVLINILDNACQAMQQKEEVEEFCAQLTIESFTKKKKVWLQITDNGIGISAKQLQNVFEPLVSNKPFGVGLGLSVVKQIIDEHQGGIEIHSEENKGTQVLLWLPLISAEEG